MRNNPASQSGIFNPRVLVAFALCLGSAAVSETGPSAPALQAPAVGSGPNGVGELIQTSDGVFYRRRADGVLLGKFDNVDCSLCSRSTAISGALSPTSSAADSTCVPVPLVNDKCPSWDMTYDGPGHGSDAIGLGLINSQVMATNPSGNILYVAGFSGTEPNNSGYDYLIAAFDAATGAQLWTSL